MEPQSRLLVADPDITSLYGTLFDISMLTVFGSGSRIRTPAELRDLFASAGLKLTRTLSTSSTLLLVEGVPV